MATVLILSRSDELPVRADREPKPALLGHEDPLISKLYNEST